MIKSVALLTLVSLTACWPVMAKTHHAHRYASRTVHHASLSHHTSLAHHASLSHRGVSHDASASDTHESHSGITCEMVRAYVAQVGLAQAAAMAESNGITASEKERARRCLAQKS